MDFDLSIDVKRATLATCASVVSVVSRTGGELFFVCSGTILDCVGGGDGTYVSTILTSASLFSCETSLIPSFWDLDTVPDDIELEVTLADGSCFKAGVVCYDFHYNIALVSIHTGATLPTARLRLLDDCMSIDPKDISASSSSRSQSFQLLPHSDRFKISPGDMVIALGRHSMKPYYAMAFPTTLSLYRCDLDCMELFTANRRIPRCGLGGPLINRFGEVVGLNFYARELTPTLPINVVSKCLDHFKSHGKFFRPSLGLDVHNLYAGRVHALETIIQKFPNTFKGVIVHQVLEESPAHCAGIREGDVIIECNGTPVHSFLEFIGMVFDKVGESVELVVLRASSGTRLNVKVALNELSPDELNSWPLPPPCRRGISKDSAKRRMLHCCDY